MAVARPKTKSKYKASSESDSSPKKTKKIPEQSETKQDSQEKERVKRWFSRISDADRVFDRWYDDFKVAKCRRYWKGFQRVGEDRLDSRNQERVEVNLIAPTIAIQIPNLYFYYPYARILGVPVITEVNGSTIEDQAQLLQDTGNTIVRDPATGFRRETLMALKESMWGFGLCEIGYSASFVDNPAYLERPQLLEDEDSEEVFEGQPKRKDPDTPSDIDGDRLKQLRKLVDKEQFFVRHIPPETFRVSISGQPCLEANDWCGYFEWMSVEDVKACDAWDKEARESIKAGGAYVKDYSSATGDVSTSSSTAITYPTDSTQDRDRDRGGQVKVWRLWDLRTRVKHTVAEGCDWFLKEGESYRNLPLYPLRFEEQDDDFYPIPPIKAMLGPQDEYNDSREMLRGLRKTIYPRFVADGGIDPDELRKLEDGGSGVIARVNVANPVPVQPVNQPTLDGSIVRTLGVSKDDLLQVSGVSGEARGQAESDTATQASIINQRSLVRDSFARLKVAEWLGNIIRGLIQLAIDNMTLPMWILRNADPQSLDFMTDASKIATLYRQIALTDLKEADQLLRWDVSVDVETLSPLTEDSLRAQITSLVTTLAQPPIAMLLHNSPPLLKIVLDRNGLRSARDQESIRMALGMLAQAPPNGSGAPSPPAPGGGGAVLAPNPTGPGVPVPGNNAGPPGAPMPPAITQPGGGPPAMTQPGGGPSVMPAPMPPPGIMGR